MGINFGYCLSKKWNEIDDTDDLNYHSDFKWSYSGFHEFRKKLALEIGINLEEMEGHSYNRFNKSWNLVDDDLKILLNHSDSEGDTTPNNLIKLIPRLKNIIKDWNNNDYDKITCLKLIKLMKICIKLDTSLIFT